MIQDYVSWCEERINSSGANIDQKIVETDRAKLIYCLFFENGSKNEAYKNIVELTSDLINYADENDIKTYFTVGFGEKNDEQCFYGRILAWLK